MLGQEEAIINSLTQRCASMAWRVIGFAEYLTEELPYRITIPSYTMPHVAGRRTAEQQLAFFDQGLSKCDGTKKRSRHQDGMAVHIGLRYRKSGRYISWSKMTSEQREIFLIIIRKAEHIGFRWGGRWRSFKDYEHLEVP